MTLEQLIALRSQRQRLLTDLDEVDKAIDHLTDRLLRDGNRAATRLRYTSLSDYLQPLHMSMGAPSSRTIADSLADISHTTVSETLNGRRVPGWEKTRMIGEYLGADMGVLQQLWAQGMTEYRRRSR